MRFLAFSKRIFSAIIRKILKIYYLLKAENRFSKGRFLSHVTLYACGNAGDNILSTCVRKSFQHFTNFKKWKIILLHSKVKNYTIEKINNSSGVIIGGGGLFLPDSNSNLISGWQWAISSEQLDLINKPIIIYSVGYNYFRGQKANSLFLDNLKKLLNKSSFIGIRNNGSIGAINALTNNDFKDKITYQPCTTTLIRKLYPNAPKKAKTNKIAINLAFDRENQRFGNKQDIILNQIAKAVKTIEKRGYEIVYVCHVPVDEKFIPYLNNENIKFSVVKLINELSESSIFFYNSVDLVLGMRGHAQMIPFGLNTEIITLGTHEKMKWFLEDIDALDWYIELTENQEKLSETIINKFIEVHEINNALTTKRLYQQQERLWQITKNNFIMINKILN